MKALVRITGLVAGMAPFLAAVILDSSGILQTGSAFWGLAVILMCSTEVKKSDG